MGKKWDNFISRKLVYEKCWIWGYVGLLTGVYIVGYVLYVVFLKGYVDIQSAVPTVHFSINQSEIYLFIYAAEKIVSTLGGN